MSGDADRTEKQDVLVLGGGLTGLAAGCVLSRAGRGVAVYEQDTVVGGIARTIEHKGFRFDLGPHRFFTKDARIEAFVQDLLGSELITVPRKTKIFLRGKYFDYPLEPMNALFGMGVFTTLRILGDYGRERVKRLVRAPKPRSLEDWVVAHFGRTLFSLYFKEYSEKIWGIPCSRISAQWVAERIRGLSLSQAVLNAFFKMNGGEIPSLVDAFLYPRRGIGRIAEALRDEIEQSGTVATGTTVERVLHADQAITGIVVRDRDSSRLLPGREFISSIPITTLLSLLDPAPPAAVREAAAQLGFRDLIVVAIMIDRKRVTDLTWIYIPEQAFPIGRIHEPVNWSIEMAPAGKTLLATEFFCFQGDAIWNAPDEELVRMARASLERLGYIRQEEVLDSVVVRAPKAYPLFSTGYEEHFDRVHAYLSRFRNLHVAGRAGAFRYLNMDHAIGAGMETAERILGRGQRQEAGS